MSVNNTPHVRIFGSITAFDVRESVVMVNRIVGVGVVLTDAHGRVLLGERAKPGEPLSWCLPGGAVDPGESFEQAAVRELAEETGIHDAGPPTVTDIILDHPSDAVRVTASVTMTRGDSDATVTEPHVFRSWHWFPLNQLPTPLFPATALILNAPNHSTHYQIAPPSPRI
ncbi:MAG: NUDIX domain-containing protein [Nonomuraea sp.]|nr:NUDIX domain-containing protein [Nonomuraea sp.]NUS05736.1 NUDIX domain-containing protein [Nonomuraea sp.]